MPLRRCLPILLVALFVTGCASNTTIAPRYTTDNPDLLRIGGDRPSNPDVRTENAGSFCVEITERWNEHGKTPDGQVLWAKDTLRKVVPCR
ncbi:MULTISPECIES: hypothetical protein [Halomonas]|uniref:Lipoprotein n=2 Tax=Halomonas chromatireducens TaxID=507626 RepID=A0A0X8HDA4_9GAMM|nr:MULTISPECIES: hypothetical protein [Halomonas]AMD00506.1 hypothetical protein LOKO_01438 [Halomonas chromatireducens]EWH03269.1 hypothetical protein Q427_04285 [Halomonas sp. BC04]MBZ0331799.1 hypothetical protein [Halomonas sp. ANAO-440]MCE9663934.1 hypothetical protein [Halomonas alkalisoli]MCE9680941.1 hypothetical protein [Halomonas alkalisoli]